MRWTPRRLKLALNFYGPFRGAAIRIDYIRDDWREIRVSMRSRWYNRNIVGCHFGGSLYAMVDPQYMIMLMNVLGEDYLVWDKAADIDFIKPGRGTVRAHFILTDAAVDQIKADTANGEKTLPNFTVRVVDTNDEIVASINKVLYVRKKPRTRSV